MIKTYTEIKDFEALADNLVYSYKDVIKDWKKFISDVTSENGDYYKEKKEQQVKLVDMISPNLRNYFKNKNKSIVAHMAKRI